MLVVIVIMSILMTAGAIGIGGIGGKGVTSGVATAESLFAEARSIAVGQRARTRVLIAKELDNNPAENLRRIVIVTAELDQQTGLEKTPTSWELSSRGAVLPDKTFFSSKFSRRDSQSGAGVIEEMSLFSSSKLKDRQSGSGAEVKGVSTKGRAAYQGEYYYYEFNAEGICTTGVTSSGYKSPSFVLGSGARSLTSATDNPKVTAAGKRDFGGFLVWRNGQTSLFRSPDQISAEIKNLTPGKEF